MLILLAIVLFVLEVKVHSYGALTIGGVAAMIIGSLMLINSPVPEMRPSLRFILPVALAISLILVFLVTLVVRAHARRSVAGREGMVGEVGTARTDLTPSGRVFVHGELWEAEVGTAHRPGREGQGRRGPRGPEAPGRESLTRTIFRRPVASPRREE